MTAGLAALAAAVRSAPAPVPPALTSNNSKDDDDDAAGRLVVSDTLPPLAQRYKYTGLLGEGTFAQLVAAADLYARPPAAVAVKIMHRAYGPIGERVRSTLGLTTLWVSLCVGVCVCQSYVLLHTVFVCL
jgi:hypothetical protein